MPSHTFTRLGYWQDSIDTNIASAETAMKIDSYSEALHAMDYQMYAYLQTAQDAAAKRILDRVPAVASKLVPDSVTGAAPPPAGYYARAAIPARYALERGAWSQAAALPASTSPTPYADAITHFARAIGAARSGHPEQTAADIERLTAIRDALSKAGEASWTAGWKSSERLPKPGRLCERPQGCRDRAAARAPDAEDASDKAAVTPGPLAPAREMLGEMLLESDRPKALAEFWTLTHEPNRYRTIAGAARAAEAAGDRATAARFTTTNCLKSASARIRNDRRLPPPRAVESPRDQTAQASAQLHIRRPGGGKYFGPCMKLRPEPAATSGLRCACARGLNRHRWPA
jgi:hypothetical protein